MGTTTLEQDDTCSLSTRDVARIRAALEHGEKLEAFLNHARAVISSIQAIPGLYDVGKDDPEREECVDTFSGLLGVLESEAATIWNKAEMAGEFDMAKYILDHPTGEA